MAKNLEFIEEVKEIESLPLEWKGICKYAFEGCIMAKESPGFFKEHCTNNYCGLRNCLDFFKLKYSKNGKTTKINKFSSFIF